MLGIFELAPPSTAGTELNADSDLRPRFMMDLSRMVRVAIRGLAKDQRMILPGSARMLRLIGRVAPNRTLMNERAVELARDKSRPARSR